MIKEECASALKEDSYNYDWFAEAGSTLGPTLARIQIFPLLFQCKLMYVSFKNLSG